MSDKVNEILRAYGLPEVIIVNGIAPAGLVTNYDLERVSKMIVRANVDERTCDICRAANGKTIGELIAAGHSGPPFHRDDPANPENCGDCRCALWGPSPLGGAYHQLFHLSRYTR
jgi:hypothetical protein